MTLRDRFNELQPRAFFLDATDPSALEQYLLKNGWLYNEETLAKTEMAGPGNMNYVLRVFTSGNRSFVVKQSRPWVEKFPQIDAPPERAIIEGQFYQLVQLNGQLKSYTPGILGFDEGSSIIVLEDLGHASDFTFLYAKDQIIDAASLDKLIHIVSTLHNNFNTDTTRERIYNRAMRRLNHEHLFVFPLMEANGIHLDHVQSGLQDVAMSYKTDLSLKQRVAELGDIYLKDGETLLHGDYYPGSWLKTADGVKLIDPEFCFFGPAEFDLAVFLAHMKMSQQEGKLIAKITEAYSGAQKLDGELLAAFTGIEVMRRIIGLAQLPLELTLEERTGLLTEARQLIMQPQQTDVFHSISSK